MKRTEDVPKNAAEQGVSEGEALKHGMEAKSMKSTTNWNRFRSDQGPCGDIP